MNIVPCVIIFCMNSLYTFEKEEENSLLELGRSLTRRLQHPAGEGQKVLEDLQAFIGDLYAIYEKVSTQNGDLIQEGIREFDIYNNSGCPLHFKLDVDFGLLKEQYYWSYDDRVLHMPEENDDPHPLINLGNSLTHRLLTLSSPHSVLLYKDFQNYYNRLTDVYRHLKRRDVAEIVKGWKVYDQIEKAGGPPHLNVTMEFSKFKKIYNWRDSGEIKDVKEVMLLTKELWEDIQDRAAHLRSGAPEPVSVEQSTIDWTPFIREVSSGSEASHY